MAKRKVKVKPCKMWAIVDLVDGNIRTVKHDMASLPGFYGWQDVVPVLVTEYKPRKIARGKKR